MDFKKFYFTQHSLKAFDDCPLKFKKRYIENIRWSTIPDEEVDKQIQAGRDFHLMAQRYFSGIDYDYEMYDLSDDRLLKWYKNLKQTFQLDNAVKYLPEYKLRLSSDGINLEANFDLISIEKDKITIWDWKTGASKLKLGEAKVKKLRSSFQTIIYMFVMKELGYLITGTDSTVYNLNMCYWEPESMEILAEILYSDELHKVFYEEIHNKIDIIKNYDYSLFNKAFYTGSCRYCEFNSLCNGGGIDYKEVSSEDA